MQFTLQLQKRGNLACKQNTLAAGFWGLPCTCELAGCGNWSCGSAWLHTWWLEALIEGQQLLRYFQLRLSMVSVAAQMMRHLLTGD